MALAQKTAGDRILAADINQFYNILKGVAASGETVTLIYNNTGAFKLQPSSDPAAGTEMIQLTNAAGTRQIALTSDGKIKFSDGTTLSAIATGATLVSRYTNVATVNVNNSSLGTYVDFGGSFTTSVTPAASDKVCIRTQGIFKKSTAGNAVITIDRSGTKLPPAATASVYTDLIGSYIPFAYEYWDTPGAGTFTYKPQIYTSDANTANVGGAQSVTFVVEVWR